MFKNEKGFTLVEMLVVLMIISVLIILIVPNLSNQTKEVNNKGCDALEAVVQAQVNSFYLENNKYPKDTSEMVKENYLKSKQQSCPNKKKIVIKDGVVTSEK